VASPIRASGGRLNRSRRSRGPALILDRQLSAMPSTSARRENGALRTPCARPRSWRKSSTSSMCAAGLAARSGTCRDQPFLRSLREPALNSSIVPMTPLLSRGRAESFVLIVASKASTWPGWRSALSRGAFIGCGARRHSGRPRDRCLLVNRIDSTPKPRIARAAFAEHDPSPSGSRFPGSPGDRRMATRESQPLLEPRPSVETPPPPRRRPNRSRAVMPGAVMSAMMGIVRSGLGTSQAAWLSNIGSIGIDSMLGPARLFAPDRFSACLSSGERRMQDQHAASGQRM